MPVSTSNTKTEEYDVAVLDDIFFAFQSNETLFLSHAITTSTYQIVIVDYLGPDEAAFHIRVDNTSGPERWNAFFDRPDPRFLFIGGEEGNQT